MLNVEQLMLILFNVALLFQLIHFMVNIFEFQNITITNNLFWHYDISDLLIISYTKIVSCVLILVVVAVKLGDWEIRHILIRGKLNDALRMLYKLMELTMTKIRDHAKEFQTNVTDFNTLIDLSGFNLREHGCFACT